MTQSEEDKIEYFNANIKRGKVFFNQIIDYYKKENSLDVSNVSELYENVLKIKYLLKPYLIEIIFNEYLKLGQFNVYESEIGTYFLQEPKFKLKENAQLFFDNLGNVFIGNHQVAHSNPSRTAEDIIREITK